MNRLTEAFITPEEFEKIRYRLLSGPNGWLLFVPCNNGFDLAKKVKQEYERFLASKGSELTEIPLLGEDVQGQLTKVFTDSETRPRLPEHVAGSNAFVFQNCHERTSGNSVNDNVWQLFEMVRVLKDHGAKNITAVTPYHPYSRQEQATFMERESPNAKLYVDLLKEAGANACLFYHPHSYTISSFYSPHMRAIALSGLDLFLSIFPDLAQMRDVSSIIAVSPDAGASKFTIHYADALQIKYGVMIQFRPKDEVKNMVGVVGDINGAKTAIITDDETITFSTLKNAAKSLVEHEKIEEIYITLSHLKIFDDKIPELVEAHERYKVTKIVVTDSIPQSDAVRSLPFLEIRSLAERFAATINRLHYNQSVSGLFYHIKRG